MLIKNIVTRFLLFRCVTDFLLSLLFEKFRRPSAKSLLNSPYFSATVKSAYLFAAPLHLLAKGGTRLYYAASFAKEGALKAMGSFVAEMCAAYCLPLVTSLLSDNECEWAYVLIKEFTKYLTPVAVQRLVLPSIQKILLVRIVCWLQMESVNILTRSAYC